MVGDTGQRPDPTAWQSPVTADPADPFDPQNRPAAEDERLATQEALQRPEGDELEEPQEEPAPRTRGKTAIRELAETLILALLIFLTVRSVVQNFKVEGSSMEPTLHHGQYLLINKAAYFGVELPLAPPASAALQPGDDPGDGARGAARSNDMMFRPFGGPERGDVVVFRFPRNPSRDFIKRVVALPGEAVEIRAGQLYVNDERVNEPYVLENPTYTREREVVPEGNYFVLGDNRNNSSDSHVWGPVPFENIIGKAWFSYWPWKDWGFIPEEG